jgi:multidrug efflux pump subunit AcrA (membrane-fusion protein)
MPKKWSFALALVFLLVSLVGCAAGEENAPTPTPLPQVVNTEKIIFTVERGPIISQREVAAEVVPAVQDQLFFRASGFINRVLVKNGDFFKKGDILAELKLDDLLDQLQQARIDLKVAQDNLDSEKLQRAYDVQRAESDSIIAQKGVDLAQKRWEQASGAAGEDARLNLDIAQEKLKTAQAWLALVKGRANSDLDQVLLRNQMSVDRLDRLVSERQLIAPYDGIVLYTNLVPGNDATAYKQAVLVGDPSKLVLRTGYEYELTAALDASTVVNMYLNKDNTLLYPVKFIPDFMPITAKKEGISISSGGDVSLNYLFFSAPEDLPLESIPVGSQVNLQIVLGSKEDALLLPPPAIRGNDEFKYVIVLEDEYHRRVEVVHIGVKTTDKWEVTANLKEGDQVLGP